MTAHEVATRRGSSSFRREVGGAAREKGQSGNEVPRNDVRAADGDRSRIVRSLSQPVDAAWLGALRVLFGASMAVSMLRFIVYGWIDEFFVDPPFHFKYWGFAWVTVLSRSGMYALFAVLVVLSLAVTLGIRHRIAGALFFLGFSYLQLLDVTTYLNHYYLASLLTLLVALAPAHHAFSVDKWLSRDRVPSDVSTFWLFVFRFQVGVVYCFAGFAKAQSDWLLDAQPLRIWLGSVTDMAIVGPLFRYSAAPTVMSIAGFLFDSSVVWALLYRRTRPFAYAAVLVFHTLTGLLFPIGMFPVIMALAALVFFPPDWPRALMRAILESRATRRTAKDHRGEIAVPASSIRAAPTPSVADSVANGASRDDDAREVSTRARGNPSVADTRVYPPQPITRLKIVVAGIYCLAQVIIPLRFLVYGGNVLWHEQGMRFSWRVMVREKNGSLTFLVREKTTGRVRHMSPRSYITRIQEREISTQPDLILQLAHRIRDDFRDRGFGDVEVRVEALVSLNGRRAALLIDPNVDLATVEDGLGKADWITPSPVERPPHTHPI